MGNETGCTGFLARTTIKPETKAGLDETESIMVRRPSLKWNLNAGARTSIQVDLLRPARLFEFHFLFPSPALLRKHSRSYLWLPSSAGRQHSSPGDFIIGISAVIQGVAGASRENSYGVPHTLRPLPAIDPRKRDFRGQRRCSLGPDGHRWNPTPGQALDHGS